MEHAYCWGPHFHWFWLVPLLFMILMVVFGRRRYRRAGDGRPGSWRRAGWRSFGCCGPGRPSTEDWPEASPDRILDRRYASGEITRELYEQMKHDLGADRPDDGSEDES